MWKTANDQWKVFRETLLVKVYHTKFVMNDVLRFQSIWIICFQFTYDSFRCLSIFIIITLDTRQLHFFTQSVLSELKNTTIMRNSINMSRKCTPFSCEILRKFPTILYDTLKTLKFDRTDGRDGQRNLSSFVKLDFLDTLSSRECSSRIEV